jgi:hypothetical protein
MLKNMHIFISLAYHDGIIAKDLWMVMTKTTLVVVLTHLPQRGGGHERPLSPFTSNQFIHCTQDEDHGVLTSSRISVSEANVLVDSSSSSSHWIDYLRIPRSNTYHIPDIHNQQSIRWVYEWIYSELYNMC